MHERWSKLSSPCLNDTHIMIVCFHASSTQNYTPKVAIKVYNGRRNDELSTELHSYLSKQTVQIMNKQIWSLVSLVTKHWHFARGLTIFRYVTLFYCNTIITSLIVFRCFLNSLYVFEIIIYILLIYLSRRLIIKGNSVWTNDKSVTSKNFTHFVAHF